MKENDTNEYPQKARISERCLLCKYFISMREVVLNNLGVCKLGGLTDENGRCPKFTKRQSILYEKGN